jgi:hypothetical protein
MKWKFRLNVMRGIYEVFMYFMYFNVVRDALVSMRIQIQLFWIRIQGAKPMRVHADLYLEPGQTLVSQKVEFLH